MVQPYDPTTFHDFEHAGWQSAAAAYPETFGPVTVQAIGPLLDAAEVAAGRHVLDVACGPGFVSGRAAARHATVVGLDFSAAMIREARARCQGVEFIEGDAHALPFPDATFDAVVMNFGVLHLARPDAAFAEAWRVLRPGGRYAFTVWAESGARAGFAIVHHAIESHGTTAGALPPGPGFFRFSDPDECRRSLAGAGFDQPSTVELQLLWTVASADAMLDAITRGGVRTSALLRAQSPAALEAIRRAVADAIQPFTGGPAAAVPMPVVLASASKGPAPRARYTAPPTR